MDHLKGLLSSNEYLTTYFENENLFRPEVIIKAQDVSMMPENATTEQREAIVTYDFHDFPEKRAGWKLDENLEFKPVPMMHVAPFNQFLQSWLFFGLLRTVIQLEPGSSIHDGDFIRPPRHDTVQTTELEKYLKRWAMMESDPQYKRGQTVRMIRAQVALDKARDVILRYCSVDGKMYRDKKGPTHVDETLALSLMVLGETSTAAKSKIVQKVGFNIRGWHGDANEGWGIPKLLIDQMEHASWCPRTIYMLKGQLRSHATSLLSAFKINKDIRVHGQRHSDAKCDEKNCRVKSEDKDGNYEMKHHPDCIDQATCRFLGPDMKEVLKILRDGSFPLLTYKSHQGEMVVHVVAFEAYTRYATISHVWADGYGNPGSNEIRECQLKFFNDLFEKSKLNKPSGQDILFWIDTLAIPVGKSPEQKKWRKTAIKQIHEIYTNALYTIVIDNGLTQTTHAADYQGTAMKILASGWMRRLWTLQEAYLSKRLLFAFDKDHLENMDNLEELYPEANDILTSNIPNAARNYFHNMLGTDRRARINDLAPANGFGILASVLKAAQWRTTSHPEHETLALATLLNVDNGSFAEMDLPISTGRRGSVATIDQQEATKAKGKDKVNEAMRELWRILNETCPGSIPSGIIFLSGERLPFEGYGWAPVTWMTGREVDYPDPLSIITAPATLTEKGLLVQYPGFLLHAENRNAILQPKSDEQFYFPVDSTLLEWYIVSWQDEKEVPTNVRKGIMEAGKPSQLAIILCRPRPREISEIALLVEIFRPIVQKNIGGHGQRQSTVYHVHIVRRVKIRREVKTNQLSQWRNSITKSIRDPAFEATNIEAPHSTMQKGKQPAKDYVDSNVAANQENLVFGEVLDSSQKWYVDSRPRTKFDQQVQDQSDTAPHSAPRTSAHTTRRHEEPLRPKSLSSRGIYEPGVARRGSIAARSRGSHGSHGTQSSWRSGTIPSRNPSDATTAAQKLRRVSTGGESASGPSGTSEASITALRRSVTDKIPTGRAS